VAYGGRTLSVVTLHEAGAALSGNYLKVELARACEPNRLIDVEIGGVTEGGVTGGRSGVARPIDNRPAGWQPAPQWRRNWWTIVQLLAE
jgi:hypothetical protein